MRTFVFDDGQTWQVELTRRNHEAHGTVSVGALFWAVDAPDQRVLGRLSLRGLALTDAQLADALRQAMRRISVSATLEA